MSTVKLTADSGGGTVAIAGPSTTTGNAALTLTLPGTASGTIATTSTAGKILQVLQTVNSTMVSEAVADSTWEDITGMSVAITPSAASNKVLVFYRVAVATTSGQYNTRLRIVRDSTAIGLGDQTGSTRPRATTAGWSPNNAYHIIGSHNTMFLDSPSTTSATTYKLQWTDSYGQTLYMNRSANDADTKYYASQASHITVMEVAA